jgi:hypothetical protein
MYIVNGSDSDFVEVPYVPSPAPATCAVHTGAPVFALSATTELSCWPEKTRLSLVSYASARAMICSVVAFAPDDVVSNFGPWYFQRMSPVSGLTASVVFAEGMYIRPLAQQSGCAWTGPL